MSDKCLTKVRLTSVVRSEAITWKFAMVLREWHHDGSSKRENGESVEAIEDLSSGVERGRSSRSDIVVITTSLLS